MTLHMPLEQFSNAKHHSIEPKATINPLANPFVLKVIPFWMGGEVGRGDLTDPARLFDPNFRVRMESLLHLDGHDIEEKHGFSVAQELEGRTGLYVVVSDLDTIRRGVRGKALGFKNTGDGIAEYVVETPAGLIIFAQNANAPTRNLAA